MNPWTIIGWMLLALVAAYLVIYLLIPIFCTYYLVMRDIKVPPVTGQIWAMPNDRRLEVTDVLENHIVYKSYQRGMAHRVYMSTSTSKDNWTNMKVKMLMHLNNGPRKVSHAPQKQGSASL